jgi:hypothetical protein
MSSTFTTTSTFTRSSAGYIASKVIADLHRLKSYYGKPSDSEIEEYKTELIEFIAAGYIKSIEYGFRSANTRVVSLKYEVRSDGTLGDDHSGSVYSQADISAASWFSYLDYSDRWWGLNESERARFKETVPVKRSGSPEPTDGNGYWVSDKTYSSDGTGTQRRTFRPL